MNIHELNIILTPLAGLKHGALDITAAPRVDGDDFNFILDVRVKAGDVVSDISVITSR